MQPLVERDARFRSWLEAHSRDDLEEEIAPMREWDDAMRRAALQDLLRLADRVREAQADSDEAPPEIDGLSSRSAWYTVVDAVRARG